MSATCLELPVSSTSHGDLVVPFVEVNGVEVVLEDELSGPVRLPDPVHPGASKVHETQALSEHICDSYLLVVSEIFSSLAAAVAKAKAKKITKVFIAELTQTTST